VIAEALAFGAAAAGAAAALDLRPRQPLRAAGRIGRRLLPRGARRSEPHAAKVGAATAAAAVGLAAGMVLPGRLALVAAGAAPVAGFFAPDVWRARHRAERAAQVRRDLPALLDLLGVAVAAGLSLSQALAEVGRRSRAPLAREWAGIAAQVALGVPLGDALEAHRRELDMPEIDSFTGALIRVARHGAPLSDTLTAQAREVRLARRRRIQEEAARAGPKMQLVVALLLVPSVMLLVAAALVAALVDGGTGEALIGF
jgi:tight adherence protein C